MGKDRKGRASEVNREGDGDASEGERGKGNEFKSACLEEKLIRAAILSGFVLCMLIYIGRLRLHISLLKLCCIETFVSSCMYPHF